MIKGIRILLLAFLLAAIYILILVSSNGKSSPLPRPALQRPPLPHRGHQITSLVSLAVTVQSSSPTASTHRLESSTKVPLNNTELRHHDWKVYGKYAIEVNVTDKKHTHREGAQIFSSQSINENTLRLVKKLQSLPITCSETPQSHKNTSSAKYGKFLEALANYSQFHHLNRGNIKARKLVWYCGSGWCGGLGDRERGVTFALLLAMLTERVLLFHWQDSRMSDKTYLEPNVIDWRLSEDDHRWLYDKKNQFQINERRRPDSALLVNVYSHGATQTLLSPSKLKLVLRSIASNHSWIAMKSNMFPSGLVYSRGLASTDWIKEGMTRLGFSNLSQLEVNKVMGLAFRYLFTFSKDIVGEFDYARKILGLTNQPYVGVHLRTGFEGSKDQEQHPKLIKDRKVWKTILDCASTHATQEIKNSSALFVASDSPLVKDLAIQHYGMRARSLKSSVIHIDHSEYDSSVEREGVMSLWVELVLLAEAHSIVMGRSGYSFLAQSLCLLPETRVLNGVTCKPLDSLGM